MVCPKYYKKFNYRNYYNYLRSVPDFNINSNIALRSRQKSDLCFSSYYIVCIHTFRVTMFSIKFIIVLRITRLCNWYLLKLLAEGKKRNILLVPKQIIWNAYLNWNRAAQHLQINLKHSLIALQWDLII